jgi:hypothetical protein
MGTNAVAYGLIPVYHPSGQVRANHGTALYKGDPVKMGTNGTIEISSGVLVLDVQDGQLLSASSPQRRDADRPVQL